MRSNTMSLVLLAYSSLALCLSLTVGTRAAALNNGEPSLASSENDGLDGLRSDRGQGEISQSQFQHMLAVRSPKYNFGLGKRRYIIEDVPGAKRLPHYNFGLGKRGSAMDSDYDGLNNINWGDDYNFLSKDNYEYDSDKDMNAAKRSSGGAYRYHFGLGKRRTYDFGLGKRYLENEDLSKRLPNRYNFGLGRR